MQLVTETVELQYGLAPWSATAKTVVMRQATLQDVYEAVAVVDMPDDMTGGRRIAYQMRIDDAQLLAQIDSIDGVEPPELALLVELVHPDDMTLIRNAGEAIKKKQRGESAPSPSSD